MIEIGLVVWCFGRMPLADVHALLALTPLAVTALSVPLLGERVGPRRWAAVAVGFLGVLVILRPGPGRDAAGRAGGSGGRAALRPLPGADPAWSAGSTAPRPACSGSCVVGAVLASFVVPFAWRTPDAGPLAAVRAGGGPGRLAHYCMIRALQLAPAAVIQPFTYTLLLWAVVIGYVGFGDLPDAWTLLGAAAIVGRRHLHRRSREHRLRMAGRLIGLAGGCAADARPERGAARCAPDSRTTREPLTIIAELRFDPAHREALLELARQHVRNTLAAERDCLRFELVAPKDDPGVAGVLRDVRQRGRIRRPPAVGRTRPGSARRARPTASRRAVRELRPVAPAWPGAVLCATPVLSDAPRACWPPWRRRASRSAGTIAAGPLTEAELIERLDGVVATIAGLEPYTERVFAAAPDLKVVAGMGVGYEHVDVAAATRHGVAVAMAFGTNHDAVADHTMALMAAAAHRIAEYDRRVRAGGWGTLLHGRLHETTVGMVGFGRIGRAVAKRCLGFNMEVLVADPVADADTVARLGYRLVELDELLRQSDFVSLHAPLDARDPPSDRHPPARADEAFGHPGQHRPRRPGRRGGAGGGARRRAARRCGARRVRGRALAGRAAAAAGAGGADPAHRRDQRRVAAGDGRARAARTSSPSCAAATPARGCVLNPEVLPRSLSAGMRPV